MKEREIGNMFLYEGVLLEVVDNRNYHCGHCYFYNGVTSCKKKKMKCFYRTDHSTIYYDEVTIIKEKDLEGLKKDGEALLAAFEKGSRGNGNGK